MLFSPWPFSPVAFEILGWPVRWYGLSYLVGAAICALLLPFFLRARGEKIADAGKGWDAVAAILLAGIVGGRLGFFLFYAPGELFSAQLFRLWEGGMSFHGGLLGGVVGALLVSRRNGWNHWRLGDALAIPLALAFGVGRLANFVNGELIGRPTDSLLGVEFPGWEGARWPSQLFEAGKNFLLAAVLFLLLRRLGDRLPPGKLFASWVFGYGALRFIIEFFREPNWLWLGLSGGQWLCLAMVLLGGAALASNKFLKKLGAR